MYNELVPATTQRDGDNAGVKALKQFHLKDAEAYEHQV